MRKHDSISIPQEKKYSNSIKRRKSSVIFSLLSVQQCPRIVFHHPKPMARHLLGTSEVDVPWHDYFVTDPSCSCSPWPVAIMDKDNCYLLEDKTPSKAALTKE